MKQRMGIATVFIFALLPVWGCEWGVRSSGEEDGDVTDLPTDRTDTADTTPDPVPDPDAGDPDVTSDPDIAPDPDAGDPDAVEPDADDLDAADNPDVAPDPDAEEPDEPPDVVDVIEDDVGPLCGNGIVESGEECDDASGFCVDCALTPPSGWIECTDSAGNAAFLFIVTIPGNHPWSDFQDRCVSDVEGYSPEGYQFYGLAVFSDQDIWDCIETSLNNSTQYYIGLGQDITAGDYSEPDGGWYWTAYNGTDWVSTAPFDPANGFLPGTFDNGGGGGSVECGRLTHASGSWEFSDYSCTASTAWSGICMIQF
jgi:hypothetical protein